jgi:hypothetical protein
VGPAEVLRTSVRGWWVALITFGVVLLVANLVLIILAWPAPGYFFLNLVVGTGWVVLGMMGYRSRVEVRDDGFVIYGASPRGRWVPWRDVAELRRVARGGPPLLEVHLVTGKKISPPILSEADMSTMMTNYEAWRRRTEA